ncbi:MAG TPA: LysR family transcriptional regulator [Terriglobales bacterium]|nr:LysR family transcriptional regulator [Terriglobales bacterium]
MIDFTSRQIRAFLLVAQHRSFSRAAGALFITPSGLSVLIRELETQLGARLFERTTRHVALTASGTELLAAAQRNLQELDSVMSRIGRMGTASGQSLSLGATPMLAATVLAQAIKEFRSHRPDLRFRLFDGATSAVMQQVESGTLDMGLGVFLRHLSGVRRTPLFRFSLVVLRPDNDPAFRRATTTWSALKGEKLISLPPSLPLQQLIDRHLARAGVADQPSLVLNYLNTQVAMVEAGEGVAIIPSYGQLACHDRKVVMSRLINPVVHLDFSQIRHAGRKLPPVAEEFTSFLQSYSARWAGRSGVL